jgi:hypothetical protein
LRTWRSIGASSTDSQAPAARVISWPGTADSIPIHRIERRRERLGIPMSRATMNHMLLHAAAELATPLIERLRPRIATLPIVPTDEASMRPFDHAGCGGDD